MKKILAFLIIAALVCSSLCACEGNTQPTDDKSDSKQNSEVQQNPENNASSGSGDLQLLSNRYGDVACNTENGYKKAAGWQLRRASHVYGFCHRARNLSVQHGRVQA